MGRRIVGDSEMRDTTRWWEEEQRMIEQRQWRTGRLIALAAAVAALTAAQPAPAQISSAEAPGSQIPLLAGRSFWLQGPGQCLTINSQGPDGSFLGQVANYQFYPSGMGEPRIADRLIRSPADRVGTVEPGFGGRVIQSWTGNAPVRGQISLLWGDSYLIQFSVTPLVTAAVAARRQSYQGRFYYNGNTGSMGTITGDYVEETQNRFLGPLAPWQPVGPPQPFTGWPRAF
jgi:hypothetical protein